MLVKLGVLIRHLRRERKIRKDRRISYAIGRKERGPSSMEEERRRECPHEIAPRGLAASDHTFRLRS